MRRRVAFDFAALAVVAVALAFWFFSSTLPPSKPAPVAAEEPAPAPAAATGPIPLTRLGDPAATPHQKLHRVHGLLQNYSAVMKTRGGPPLSSNAEFTRAFTGKNRLGVVFLAPDNPAISTGGELLDAWDTPYFFHALAADSFEVVSAGPDRIPFNADDLIFPRSPHRNSLAEESGPRRE